MGTIYTRLKEYIYSQHDEPQAKVEAVVEVEDKTTGYREFVIPSSLWSTNRNQNTIVGELEEVR
jgi:hypothetical protein